MNAHFFRKFALVAVAAAFFGCTESPKQNRTHTPAGSSSNLWLVAAAGLGGGGRRTIVLDFDPDRGALVGMVTRPGRPDSGEPPAMMLIHLGSRRRRLQPTFVKDAIFGPAETIFYVGSNDQLWERSATGQKLIDDRVWQGLTLSPDGNRLLYVRETRPFETEIWMQDLAAGSRKLIVHGRGVNDRPAWTSDGTAVVFVSARTGVASLWTVSVHGGNPRQLTNRNLRLVPGQAPSGFVPVPSGSRPIRTWAGRAYYAVDGQLLTVDLRSGNAARLQGARRVLALHNGRLAIRTNHGAVQWIDVGATP